MIVDPSALVTLRIAIGVQCVPSLAKVPYALAIDSGEVSWVPSTIDMRGTVVVPGLAGTKPTRSARAAMSQRLSWLCIVAKAVLTENRVARSTDMLPLPWPSELFGSQVVPLSPASQDPGVATKSDAFQTLWFALTDSRNVLPDSNH